ncbi:hypothetical protein [Catellatospora paridis]|uniref:hypothetical protein n=1 Tax=Catellatospora paridis TaxID=1617086 RepID=UPI001E3C9DD6|nr:hypothetical protein [Catellatospora paridis]
MPEGPPIAGLQRYEYVGSPEIRDAVASAGSGRAILAAIDVAEWLGGLPARDRSQPHTFVVDVTGVLRVAARRSEHVACAGGEPVLSAGEITFTRHDQGWLVSEVTNQSTGYCPRVSSWTAVAAACERAGLDDPGGFTTAFEFRHCPECQQINIVKDEDFTCLACGVGLPAEWNFTGRPDFPAPRGT